MEQPTLVKAEHKHPSPISLDVKPPSGSADLQFLVSYGVIVSCRLGQVERIRNRIEEEGGRIIFQTVSNGPLFLLREGQIERAMKGDVSALAEIHKRKQKRSEMK